MLTIGLAMLQGARHEHAEALRGAAAELSLDIEIRELRKSEDVVDLHAIVLPGGESTSMTIASQSEELYTALWDFIKEKQIPVLGTCAGAILLCQQQLIDAKIDRNAFGRQRESFIADLNVELNNEKIKTECEPITEMFYYPFCIVFLPSIPRNWCWWRSFYPPSF